MKVICYSFVRLFPSEESDEEEERPTRRRRLAERAAEGIEEDEEVTIEQMIVAQLSPKLKYSLGKIVKIKN